MRGTEYGGHGADPRSRPAEQTRPGSTGTEQTRGADAPEEHGAEAQERRSAERSQTPEEPAAGCTTWWGLSSKSGDLR